MVADDVFVALEIVREELDALVDSEHDHAVSLIEQAREYDQMTRDADDGDWQRVAEYYRDADLKAQEVDEWANLLANIRNIDDQHSGAKPRAPIYQDDDEGNARLLETARNLIDRPADASPYWRTVNEDSPFYVWECDQGDACELYAYEMKIREEER